MLKLLVEFLSMFLGLFSTVFFTLIEVGALELLNAMTLL